MRIDVYTPFLLEQILNMDTTNQLIVFGLFCLGATGQHYIYHSFKDELPFKAIKWRFTFYMFFVGICPFILSLMFFVKVLLFY